MPKAIVIGGGAIGVASAYYLNKTGWDVTVIEKNKVGHGCSFANSCLVVPSHSHPIPGPGVISQAMRWMLRRNSPFYIQPRLDLKLGKFLWNFRRYCNQQSSESGFSALLTLSRESLDLYEGLIKSGDVQFFFQRAGLLEVFLTQKEFKDSSQTRDALIKHGFKCNLLSREEAIALEPSLSRRFSGALYIKGEAHGYSYGYVRSLSQTAAKQGVKFISGRAIERILSDSKKILGVSMVDPAEQIDADLVVLAAGSWSPRLAKTIGIDIPLQPAKGYSCTIDTYDGAPQLPILIKERRVIVTPLQNKLRFGGTMELSGLNEQINPIRYKTLVKSALNILRKPPPMINEQPWSGLRPVTPDGLPIISATSKLDGLLIATGHAMLGFTQSPITGKLVSEIANGQLPSVSVTPFALDRFKS